MFIFFGAYRTSWICKFVFFIKFRKVPAIISSHFKIFWYQSLPPPLVISKWHECQTFWFCITSPYISPWGYIILSSFSVDQIGLILFICLQVHWLTPLSSAFCQSMSQSSENFISVVFFSSKVSIWCLSSPSLFFFFKLLFLGSEHPSFHLFQGHLLLLHGYHSCFKIW